MTRLLDRLATGDGVVARVADRMAARLLPEVTASGSCWWTCGAACYNSAGWWGTRQLEYCSGGYYTGNSRCVASGC